VGEKEVGPMFLGFIVFNVSIFYKLPRGSYVLPLSFPMWFSMLINIIIWAIFMKPSIVKNVILVCHIWLLFFFYIQCKLLNVITHNVVIWLMWPNCPRFIRSQITNKQPICISRQSVIFIIRLKLSLSICPKVITLSSFHCAYFIASIAHIHSVYDGIPTLDLLDVNHNFPSWNQVLNIVS